jgi:hypothetical protein
MTSHDEQKCSRPLGEVTVTGRGTKPPPGSQIVELDGMSDFRNGDRVVVLRPVAKLSASAATPGECGTFMFVLPEGEPCRTRSRWARIASSLRKA